MSAAHVTLFQPGASLAERIANQFKGTACFLQIASAFYAGLVVMVIGMLTSAAARMIAGPLDVQRTISEVV